MTDVRETEQQESVVEPASGDYFTLVGQYDLLADRLREAEARADEARRLQEMASAAVAERITALSSTIDQLTGDIAQQRNDRADDAQFLSRVLSEELIDNDYAELYDEIVQRANRRLTYELETRRRNFRVTVQYEVKFAGVLATDVDDAIEQVRSSVRDIEMTIDEASVDFSATSYPSSSSDWEVEEDDD